jgi:hypothetical protein
MLLKVVSLVCNYPTGDIKQMFQPQHVVLINEGRQLRARLPAYLDQRRALFTAHCPLLAVLQEVVAAYTEPTREDVWDSELR